MLNARAIVNCLLEAEERPEDIDWSPDPDDPDSFGLTLGMPGSFPGVPGKEPLLRLERYRDKAKRRSGYMQAASAYAYGQSYRSFPPNTRTYKIGNNTYAVYWEDGAIGVQLHGTIVVKREANGSYVVNTGGYESCTTMSRLSDYLPFGWGLYSKSGSFYWFNHTGIGGHAGMWNPDKFGRVIPYTDGDTLLSSGELVPQAEVRLRRVRKKRNEPPAQ